MSIIGRNFIMSNEIFFKREKVIEKPFISGFNEKARQRRIRKLTNSNERE